MGSARHAFARGLGLAPRSADPPVTPGDAERVRTIVAEHLDFAWRSLRRLGVIEADLADAAQQVFLVVARKAAMIREGSERSFVFQCAVRAAADARRARRRLREVAQDEFESQLDHAPWPDHQAEQRWRRALLDEVLDAMSIELRTVFVLSELEELTMADIAKLVQIPPGTVASRLRRARAQFQREAERIQQRQRRAHG